MMTTTSGALHGASLADSIPALWPQLLARRGPIALAVQLPDATEPAELFVGDEFRQNNRVLLDVVLRSPSGVAVLVFDKHSAALQACEWEHDPAQVQVAVRLPVL